MYDVDGHNKTSIKNALISSINNDNPAVIICNTVMGKGISFAEGTAEWHWRGKIDDNLANKMFDSLKDN